MPETIGTFLASRGSLGSLGALAVMITREDVEKHTATPVGFMPAQPSGVHHSGAPDQLPLQFTGSGVTVTGGALKVPVATNLTSGLAAGRCRQLG